MEIDFKEMTKQKKESILQSGKYVKCEILVGKDDEYPIAHCEVKASLKELAKLIQSMEAMKKAIISKEPYVLKELENIQLKEILIKSSDEEKFRKIKNEGYEKYGI